MKRRILADWRVYNANSSNASTEDCVKRALTIAYGLHYDDVAKELNAIKRKIGAPAFNYDSVYTRFLKAHGYVNHYVYPKDDMITVREWIAQHPVGTYFLEVGTKSRCNHVVAVIDGNFYDSWDCSNNIVYGVYSLKEGESEPDYDFNVEGKVKDAIEAVMEKQVAALAKKMPYCDFIYGLRRVADDSTLIFHIRAETEKQTRAKRLYPFCAKVNRRLTEEENIKKLVAKIGPAIREWGYALRKDIEDREMLAKEDLSNFKYGNKMLLAKLPDWARPLIKEIEDYRDVTTGWFEDIGIKMSMKALPDDPRAETAPTVEFEADNLTDLRAALEDYRTKFRRWNYDY